MDNEQIKELISQLKAAGLDDEKIMDVFYKTFTAGKMSREDLEVLAEHMGFELTDEFKNDKTPDPIEGGAAEGEITKEEAENAKALEPGETASEFKDKIDEMKEEPEEKPESEPVKGEEDEKEGWEKAQKMFKI